MHIALTAANLGLLSMGTLIDVLSGRLVSQQARGICVAVFFLLAFVVTLLSSTLKLEQKWYTARAVAESAKTLAWKYMMRARSSAAQPSEPSPELRISADLTAILKDFREIGAMLGGERGQRDQITPVMRSVRNCEVTERQQIYIQQRINAQRKWYSNASDRNRRMSTTIAVLVAVTQLVAVAAAGASVAGGSMKLSSVLAGAASSLIGWGKLRQYGELAESYGITAQDLGLVEERGKQLLNEQEFAEFVEDSEAAISREHIVWRARRVGK